MSNRDKVVVYEYTTHRGLEKFIEENEGLQNTGSRKVIVIEGADPVADRVKDRLKLWGYIVFDEHNVWSNTESPVDHFQDSSLKMIMVIEDDNED